MGPCAKLENKARQNQKPHCHLTCLGLQEAALQISQTHQLNDYNQVRDRQIENSEMTAKT